MAPEPRRHLGDVTCLPKPHHGLTPLRGHLETGARTREGVRVGRPSSSRASTTPPASHLDRHAVAGGVRKEVGPRPDRHRL